jgi:hypothetical protein
MTGNEKHNSQSEPHPPLAGGKRAYIFYAGAMVALFFAATHILGNEYLSGVYYLTVALGMFVFTVRAGDSHGQ